MKSENKHIINEFAKKSKNFTYYTSELIICSLKSPKALRGVEHKTLTKVAKNIFEKYNSISELRAKPLLLLWYLNANEELHNSSVGKYNTKYMDYNFGYTPFAVSPFDYTVKKLSDIENEIYKIDWNCIFCNEEIICDVRKSNIKDLSCKKCKTKSLKISDSVHNNIIKFIMFSKNYIDGLFKEFEKYTNKIIKSEKNNDF